MLTGNEPEGTQGRTQKFSKKRALLK